MDTRQRLVDAALLVLERDGIEGFSTRAVCSIVEVQPPTLYHHFGSADGLLSATIAEAFEQFMLAKSSSSWSTDPWAALRGGWDAYVNFAAERPRLYAAMMARLLAGKRFPAAEQGFRHLRQQVSRLSAAGELSVSEDTAVHIAWASVNSVALLYAMTAVQKGSDLSTLDAQIAGELRERAVSALRGFGDTRFSTSSRQDVSNLGMGSDGAR